MQNDTRTTAATIYSPANFRLRYEPVWLSLGALLLSITLTLALLNLSGSDPRIPHQDKVLHALAFFSLTLWFAQLFRGFWKLVLIMGFMLTFGVTIEFLQGLTAYRDASKMDVVADALGIGMAGLLSLTPLRRTLSLIERLLP